MQNAIKKGLVGLIFGTFLFGYSQESDLSTKIAYTYFPQSDSDNSFRRFRVRVNYPFELGERSYLIPGVEYRNVHLKYVDNAPFPVENLERFESFTARLTYTFGLPKDWRFAVRGGVQVASNFSRSDVLANDVIWLGGIYLIKDRSEEEVDLPWRILVGIRYSTKSGRPFPLPVVNYFKTIDEHWEYTLGVPKTKLTYFFDKKNSMNIFAEADDFYANIQEPINFVNSAGDIKYAADISMIVALAGIGYEHFFTEHLVAFCYAGYTVWNDIELRNAHKDKVYSVNADNSFYSLIGLEFKL